MYDNVAYIELCAAKLKAIRHTAAKPRFHIMNGLANLDQLLQNLHHADTGFHLLASGNIDGAIGYSSDNPTDRQMNQFYALKRVDVNNYNDIATAKKECKALAQKVIGKMLYDCYLANTTPADPHGLKNLEVRSFSYQTVGPLADNFFGIEVTFDVFNKTDLVFVANDWDE